MVQALVVFAAVFFLASGAGAWQVTLKNSCNELVQIQVYAAERLLDRMECAMEVLPGKMGTCVLPGNVCPTRWYWTRRKINSTSGSYTTAVMGRCPDGWTCCRNVQLEATGGGCAVVPR